MSPGRTIKRQYNKTLGQLARLQSRCRKGSKRWRRLQYTKARERCRKERRVRDLRHKGTRQVVDFCRAAGVQTLYVGDPHGVRNQSKGRHHNQRMSQWEYGKDKQYLQVKYERVGIVCCSGSERGTSSRCPRCDWKKKPKGRNWTWSSLWLCGPPRYRGEHEHASPRLWFADWLSDFAYLSTARPPAEQAAG